MTDFAAFFFFHLKMFCEMIVWEHDTGRGKYLLHECQSRSCYSSATSTCVAGFKLPRLTSATNQCANVAPNVVFALLSWYLCTKKKSELLGHIGI